MAYVPAPDKKKVTVLQCELDQKVSPNSLSYVRFSTAHYAASNARKPDEVDKDLGLAHIRLSGERLSIKADGVAPGDAVLTINDRRDPISSTPTALDADSIVWLADLEELAPNHGDIKQVFFSQPASASPVLVSRVDFSQGRLGTTGVEKVLVPFVNGQTVIKHRAMARDLLLQMHIDANKFVLQSKPLDNPGAPANRDMLFEATDGSTVEIVIGNEPYEDIYRDTPPIDPVDVLEKQASGEFTYYHRLCQNPPPPPLTLPQVKARPGLHTFCSVAKFNSTALVGG